MSLTQEKISSLKKLTALTEGGTVAIDGVLDSFASLQSLRIPSEKRVTRSGRKTLELRPDVVIPSSTRSEDLLACSPQRVIAKQISLSSIMHGE